MTSEDIAQIALALPEPTAEEPYRPSTRLQSRRYLDRLINTSMTDLRHFLKEEPVPERGARCPDREASTAG
ncbi:hypothetical protein ACGFYQ_39870 [Streptomyces sp. NPDC048258]|uniref:hypothetical protein n=1 Tax=Streptomyces sp. NPDC048258 TaxID=3365527 RepID=UPI00370FA99C